MSPTKSFYKFKEKDKSQNRNTSKGCELGHGRASANDHQTYALMFKVLSRQESSN